MKKLLVIDESSDLPTHFNWDGTSKIKANVEVSNLYVKGVLVSQTINGVKYKIPEELQILSVFRNQLIDKIKTINL